MQLSQSVLDGPEHVAHSLEQQRLLSNLRIFVSQVKHCVSSGPEQLKQESWQQVLSGVLSTKGARHDSH